jgi:lipid-binding SYLF domain-containing protein
MKKLTLALISTLVIFGCSPTPDSPEEQAELSKGVSDTIKQANNTDPGIAKFFETAYGYVVFPEIAKGAAGVGGAYGQGEVYEQKAHVGYADVTQATVGVQLGGQTYTEIIFFQHKAALDNFKSGEFEIAAGGSIVAVKSGSSGSADYVGGVIVFTLSEDGLMFEAALGGQDFEYEPK